jgi:hypothetical protein
MKKLSIILVLACLIASNSFAEKRVKLRDGQIVDLDTVKAEKPDCSRYEIKDDDQIYYDGKLKGSDGGIGNTLYCGDRIKGWDKAKQRQLHRERQLQTNGPNNRTKK